MRLALALALLLAPAATADWTHEDGAFRLEARREPPRISLFVDDERAPRWTVDVYRPAGTCHLSPDGRHFIWVRRAGALPHEVVLAFYESGRLLAEYSLATLLPDARNRMIPSSGGIRWFDHDRYDASQQRYVLFLHGSQPIVFDVLTGRAPVDHGRTQRLWMIAVALGCAALCFNVGFHHGSGRWPGAVTWFAEAGVVVCIVGVLA